VLFDTADLASRDGPPDGADWASTKKLVAGGPAVWSALAAAAKRTEPVAKLSELRLGPPIPDPDKILCLGLNYRAHAAESKEETPTVPVLFAKFRNSLVGHCEPVAIPAITKAADYEAELAVVIGRRCRNVTAAEAMGYVGGAMPFNDVSARDMQHATSQWTAGKAVDGFAPCGPTLTLTDELPDLQNLRISTRVNGVVVQDASTASMIFPIAEAVAFISSFMTLEPGDIIATGTPAGVGISRDPQLLLGDGDVVEVEIQGLGRLTNRFVAEARP